MSANSDDDRDILHSYEDGRFQFVIACCDTPPALETSKHDFGAVATFVSAFAVSNGDCSGFSSWNARLDALFLQGPLNQLAS